MNKLITIVIAAVFLFASFLGGSFTVYAATPTITGAKIIDPHTVTIVYSESVSTSIGDYTNFSGALSGRNITNLSGGGGNTITLTFDGGTFAPDASGYLSVASTTISTSDSSPFASGSFNVTDGQSPALSSVTVSSNNVNNSLAKIGATVNLSFNAAESINTPSVTITGHSVSMGGSGSGPYTASYTISSGDTEEMVPIFITFTDIAGNNGRASVNISSGSARPTIASITSNATSPGVLKVGDSIAFTLTPNIVEPLASVSGYYNGVSLTWSTYNGGATYVATYTAANGNADQTYPLQINNVTLTNQFGSASSPASGYDVQKTIDAHPPIVGEVMPIASPATTPTPSYIFSSSDNGTIRYSGDCLSQTTYASAGINTIIFNALSTGLHNNCAISVADNAGNVSNQLNVSPFTVQGATEALTAQIQALQNQLTQLQSQQSTVGSYKFLNPLKFGSTGTDVTELQKRLIAEGVYSGPVTGYYGALTQAAVKRYQAKHGLPQLGIVGPATRTLLNK